MQIDYGSREFCIACIVGLAIGACGLSGFVMARGRRGRLRRSRELKAERLRASVDRWKRRALSEISEERSEAIVSLPFGELSAQLQCCQLSAVEVLRAYQRKAAVENEKYNFVCEPVEEAEELALACDRVVDKKSKPLLGIPISIKESFNMKGYDSTYGLADKIFQPSTESSASVQVVVSQGAVPFIRTNIPQTMLTIDSHNPIYGYTVNPHNPERSCGGSSGGEGAALGSWASIIGLGSDVGGSLRIPAAWCGVCSLKPTASRTPWPCMSSFCGGQNIVKVASGPMARSVDGLVALAQTLFSREMCLHDPYIGNAPFSSEIYSDRRRLRIGYFIETGVIKESRSAYRAVMETKAALEKRGHELVPWSPPRMQWAATYAFVRVIFGDGGETFMANLRDDEVSPVLYEAVQIFAIPMWLRRLLVRCLRAILPAYMCDYLTSMDGVGSVANWWKLQEDVDNYRKEVLECWQNSGLDALICPAMPCPAPPLGYPSKAIGMVCYMFLFNLVNFPAGVLPVTTASEEDAAHDELHYPAKDRWHSVLKEGLKGSVGLPVAVQCTTLPNQEELCLRLMKEVEECFAAGSKA